MAKRRSVEAVSVGAARCFRRWNGAGSPSGSFFPRQELSLKLLFAPDGAAQAAPPAELASEKTDPFAGVRVIGFIESGRSPRVLIAIGSTLKTISVGEPVRRPGRFERFVD